MAHSPRRNTVFGTAVFILVLALVLALGAVTAYAANLGGQVADRAAAAKDRSNSIKDKSRYVDELAKVKKDFTYTYVEIPSQRFGHTITAATITASGAADDAPVTDSDDPPASGSQPAGPRGIVVMVHGLGGAKETILTPARMFLEMGYDVLTIDERRSGGNTASANGSGVLESFDVLDAVRYARTHLGGGGPLILWGESYGGAASAIAASRDAEYIDGLILDCPVSDARYLMRKWTADKSAETGIPIDRLLTAGDLVNRVRYGFSLDDADVTRWVGDIQVPTLVYVSEADKVTPAWMGQDIYDALPTGSKTIVTSKSSPHVRIREKEPKLYRNALKEFMPTVGAADRGQLADKP